MKNLNEILNEGIFNDNISGDVDNTFVEDLKKFININIYKIDIEIYKSTKTIKIPYDGDVLFLNDNDDDKNSVFHGFPTKKWKIVNKNGAEFTKLRVSCQLDDLLNIPDSIKEIILEGSWYNKKYSQNELNNILERCNNAKNLRSLTVECHLPKTDLSKLTKKLQRLNIYNTDNINTSVVFNPNQNVSVLEIGYNIYKLENLPANLKQISTKCRGDDLIRIMHDANTDNNDISKIVFKGRYISPQDVETIIRDASGQEDTEEKKRFDKNSKLISSFKINNTDPTKDAVGKPLKYGDIVYITNSPYSPFDVYIGVAGSMIKCLNSQSKPKFVIKVENE